MTNRTQDTPHPDRLVGPFLAVALILAIAAVLFGPCGVVPEAGGQTPAYREFTPSAQQSAALRSVGPVDCQSVGLQFESAEGLRQFLWTKPAWSAPWAGFLESAGCVVLAEDEDGNLVSTGEDAGEILQDTLAPPLAPGAPSCRAHGFTGGHSSDFQAAWETVHPGSEPTVGQWFRVKCHHGCGRVWCGDGGLLSQAACLRADNDTPWAPGPFKARWREEDWLLNLDLRKARGCPHPEDAAIRAFFGEGESPPPPPPPPPPDPEPDPEPEPDPCPECPDPAPCPEPDPCPPAEAHELCAPDGPCQRLAAEVEIALRTPRWGIGPDGTAVKAEDGRYMGFRRRFLDQFAGWARACREAEFYCPDADSTMTPERGGVELTGTGDEGR